MTIRLTRLVIKRLTFTQNVCKVQVYTCLLNKKIIMGPQCYISHYKHYYGIALTRYNFINIPEKPLNCLHMNIGQTGSQSFWIGCHWDGLIAGLAGSDKEMIRWKSLAYSCFLGCQFFFTKTSNKLQNFTDFGIIGSTFIHLVHMEAKKYGGINLGL